MRELVREKLGEEEACPYLPGERSSMRYRIVDNCSAPTYQRMLERGWRRFGTLYFRPACLACHECRSLRVDVERFRPNRSMRRVWRRNRDLRTIARTPPTLTRDHLELYDRYHADMSRRKSWPEKVSEPFDYYLTFVNGHQEFGHELLYFLDGRLVCVALVDVLPDAASAVYAYYDPDLRSRSLGVFSVLRQIAFARERGLAHLYLGYWVSGCESMRYKANYGPHQILEGRPEASERPEWRDAQATP